MADVCMSQFNTKFPNTEPLDACYNSVVPTSTTKFEGIEHLRSVLAEKKQNSLASETILPLLVPTSVYHPFSTTTHVEGDGISLSERIKQLQGKLLTQISSLQRSIHIHEQHLKDAMPGIESLLTASQECPSLAACVLCAHNETKPTLSAVKPPSTVKCVGGKNCTETALPFTRFCLKHINCDSSQVLYRSCQAIDKQSLTQCREPVLDILSEEVVCHKHMNSQDVLKPPSKKKQHLSQVKLSRLSGVQSKARRSTKDKGATHNKVVMKSSKPNSLSDPKPVTSIKSDVGATPANQSKSTENDLGSRPHSRPQSSKSLDDLLTLSSFAPPLPTLDLPPLKADIGEIMMAGEDSFSSDDAPGEAEP